jgi:hypothetical protein
MNRKLLFTDPPFSIWREHGVRQEAIEFLKHVVLGSGGVIYEHKTISQIIPHLPNPDLLYATEHDDLIATVVFCRNKIEAAGRKFNSYYARYFAAGPQIRGRGIVKKLSAQVMDLAREGETEKTIFFGVIEATNKASYNVGAGVGYRPIGRIKTIGFSRFFPKKSRRIEKLTTAEEQAAMLELLRAHYRGHTLVHFDFLFINEGYFVIKEEGEIVAGAQLHLGHWIIKRMPGLMGKIMINVLPHIPILNTLFNPRKFIFASFEGIYCRPGYEDRLFELFEGLLARQKLKTAIFWMAEESPFYEKIVRHRRLGIIHEFVKDSDTVVMASFRNMTPEEEKLFDDLPIYASSLDYL